METNEKISDVFAWKTNKLMRNLLLIFGAWLIFCGLMAWRWDHATAGVLMKSLAQQSGKADITLSKLPLVFKSASPKFENATEWELVFKQLSDYLSQHPSQLLVITGKATQKEQSISTTPNLGLLRANVIREILLVQGASKSQIVVTGALGAVEEWNAQQYPIDFTISDFSLKITKQEADAIEIKDNFKFEYSDFFASISDRMTSLLVKVVKYFEQHPAAGLEIVGEYGQSEENSSKLDNLGLARAEQIKTILIELGMSPDRLETKGQLNEQLDFFDTTIIGGIIFNIKTP